MLKPMMLSTILVDMADVICVDSYESEEEGYVLRVLFRNGDERYISGLTCEEAAKIVVSAFEMLRQQ
jgi:hypothetical protein